MKKSKEIQCSVANEDDLKSPKPVRIRVESMDFQGDVKLSFNQKLVKPDIIQELNSTTIREYIEFYYFSTYNQKVDEQVKYELSVKEWTDLYVIVNLKFEKPKEVSSDEKEDKLRIKLVQPQLFVS